MKVLFGTFLALSLFNVALVASTVDFGSHVTGTIEGNDYNGTNVVTIPAAAWLAPIGTSEWESIQTDSLNPVIPNGTQVNFSFAFNLSGTPGSGTVGVMVDDTGEVTLNGVVLADNLGSPLGTHCAVSQPNCTSIFNLNLTPYLVSGVNTLDVLVEQDGALQFGVDVYGTATSSMASAPEPQPILFTGVGLALLAVGSQVWLRRRRAVRS